MAKRTGTSANQLKSIVSTVVDVAGGDVSKYYLSYSYIYKGHKRQANDISQQVKAEWASYEIIDYRLCEKQTNC